MKEKIYIKIKSHGMAADHNLMCWLCEEEPAVYSMHPEWVFKPCWSCQEKIKDNSRSEITKKLGELIYKVQRGFIRKQNENR